MTEFQKQARQSLLVQEIACALWQIELLSKGVERPAARFIDMGKPNRWDDSAAQIALKFMETAHVIPLGRPEAEEVGRAHRQIPT